MLFFKCLKKNLKEQKYDDILHVLCVNDVTVE